MTKLLVPGICILAFAMFAQVQQSSGPIPLELNKPVERESGPGHSDTFTLPGTSGQFLQLVAIQMGVDVVVSVVSPTGKEIIRADSPNYELGPERASWIAEESGVFKVNVSKSLRSFETGRYTIQLTTANSPTEDNRRELAAERVFYQAVAKDRSGDKQSVAEALKLYQDAAVLWHRLSDNYEEALSMHRIGLLISNSGDNQKALAVYQQALPIWRAAGDKSGESLTLNNLCVIHNSLAETNAAREFCLQALSAARAVKYRTNETRILINLASTYSAPLDQQKVYQDALLIYTSPSDRLAKAETLVNLANLDSSIQNYAAALDLYQEATAIYHAVNDRKSEAGTLVDIGGLYSLQKDNQKALEFYQQAVPLYRGLGDSLDEADTLLAEGNVEYALQHHQQALGLYKQVLPVYAAIADHYREANALFNAGNVYYALKDYTTGLESYEQALSLYRDAKNQAGEASTLSNIGNIYYSKSDYHKAVGLYQQALLIYRAEKNRSGEAAGLYNVGNSAYEMGTTSAALNSYSGALLVYRELSDRAGEAKTLTGMGNAYHLAGDNEESLRNYERALALFRSLDNRPEETRVLLGLALVHQQLGHLHTMLECTQKALDLARATGQRAQEAEALMDQGLAYSDLGDKQKAVATEREALSLSQSLNDRAAEASALRSLCGIYSDLELYQDALRSGEQSLSISESLANRNGEADSLHNLNRVYSKLKDYQKAVSVEERAFTLYSALGSRAGEAWSLVSLGIDYSDQGKSKEAFDYYAKARQIYSEMKDPSGEANVLALTGIAYSDLREYKQALSYLNQALVPVRSLGDQSREAALLTSIGNAQFKLGDRQAALEAYIRAPVLAHSAGDRWVEVVSLDQLSDFFRSSRPELAIVFGKQSINLLQSIRRDNRGLQDAFRTSYEKSIESYYRSLASLLVDRQRFGEAEEVLNLLKDKEAADFIRRDSVTDELRSATLLDREKTAVERYDQIVNQVVVLGKQRATLSAKTDLSTAELDESKRLDQDLEAANTVLLRFFDEEQKTFAPDSGLSKRVDEFKEAEGLQDALEKLGPDVVAIYTLVTPDKYIAMLVTSGARKAYTTQIKEADLNAKIFAFRQQLQDPNSDPVPLAQQLYSIIFPEHLRQDLDSLHVRTIMWSIDSTLRYIPFSALHDGKGYLVQTFRQSLITPLSIKNLTENPSSNWDGIGFGVSQGKSPLPSVPGELHSIFRDSPESKAPVPGVVLLDAAFTRAAFEEDLRRKRNHVVHIATHFTSRPGVAASSELLLGDGPISLAELEAKTRLFNGVDLLTLSACNTAFTNKNEDGREVDSFGTIAQRLGAKGVIASLWGVDDSSTATLMETMYSLRQNGSGMTKTEALREAQEQMATGVLRSSVGGGKDSRGLLTESITPKSKNWTHPYYWAPFILIGNWK